MKKSDANDLIFDALVKQAVIEGNAAGDTWMREHTQPVFAVVQPHNGWDGPGRVVGTMLDVCAIVYLMPTDKRTAFFKWGHRKYDWKYSIRLPGNKWNMRQEMGLQEAVYGAQLAVFTRAGITGIRLWSRID